MKSYTDLEQSKKLAEILPIESADMVYIDTGYCSRVLPSNDIDANSYPTICPCWSLASLLDQLDDVIYDKEDSQWKLIIKKENVQYDLYYLIVYGEQKNIELDRFYDNLIDCCYEMILKLKERNLI